DSKESCESGGTTHADHFAAAPERSCSAPRERLVNVIRGYRRRRPTPAQPPAGAPVVLATGHQSRGQDEGSTQASRGAAWESSIRSRDGTSDVRPRRWRRSSQLSFVVALPRAKRLDVGEVLRATRRELHRDQMVDR